MKRRTVLSVFGLQPLRIGGFEMFAREFSRQLAAKGWNSVLGFLQAPPPAVRQYLESPNTSFEAAPAGRGPYWTSRRIDEPRVTEQLSFGQWTGMK